jgi:hypothetical protein
MSEAVMQYGSDKLPAIENFQRMLNQYPPKVEVRINKLANNSEYLPINVVERVLDEMYSGLWEVVNFRTQVIANEIVGSLELRVYHPTAKVWLTRTGAAAVMIQIKRDAALAVENKIVNTLSKDYPHLKAECLKNAAKSLGVRFGRNLNRGAEDEYNYLSEQVDDLSQQRQVIDQLLETARIDDKQRERIVQRLPRMTAAAMAEMVAWLQARQ